MPENETAAKLRVYRTLYHMNLSFAHIVAHCRALGKSRVLTPKFSRLYQSYAQELQAEINWDVIEIMDGVESDDTARFGRARSAREKELRDPDDVFIEAEERRRELARQAKRRGVKRTKRKTTQSKTNHRQQKNEARLVKIMGRNLCCADL
jgi:hypothetical protein